MNRINRLITVAAAALFVATATFAVQAQDVPAEILACISDGSTKIGRSFIQHPDPAKLAVALKAYETKSTDYPEGTIVRMIPGEAMVKRTNAAFPQSNGWEYFALTVTPQGTTVKARGYEASNGLGTCQNCHSGAAKGDYICASGGCTAVPLTDERIAAIQKADPRCAK